MQVVSVLPEFLPASRLVCLGAAVARLSQPPREETVGSREPVNSWPWQLEAASWGGGRAAGKRLCCYYRNYYRHYYCHLT